MSLGDYSFVIFVALNVKSKEISATFLTFVRQQYNKIGKIPSLREGAPLAVNVETLILFNLKFLMHTFSTESALSKWYVEFNFKTKAVTRKVRTHNDSSTQH